MKLVIREYLASLKERDELDAVLPDLLTELGFTVYSRPARGTRQYGVDVAAVGPGQDGIRRVHLFSVKWAISTEMSGTPPPHKVSDHRSTRSSTIISRVAFRPNMPACRSPSA
ncbi:hypothetical protein C1T17_08795 [Sphingobium sp. SCG-1]|nr:hypothetical protein C1T17_08795 [Sphingobium sp. SCG-1]